MIETNTVDLTGTSQRHFEKPPAGDDFANFLSNGGGGFGDGGFPENGNDMFTGNMAWEEGMFGNTGTKNFFSDVGNDFGLGNLPHVENTNENHVEEGQDCSYNTAKEIESPRRAGSNGTPDK